MALRTPQEIWTDCCDAALHVAAQHGPDAAIDYVVGDKLMMFAELGESRPEYLAELPGFSARIRSMFTADEIIDHFRRAAEADRVESDILDDATPEEAEALKDGFEDDRKRAGRRQWLQSMLLQSGS
jgi:hypothetical protein